MQTVSLSIPYLVLSTQHHMDGKRQVHVRTPFGYIDISIQLTDGTQNTPLFNVAAEGDFDPWMLNHQMPPAFRSTLFKLIGKIALLHCGWPVRKQCRLVICFKGASSDVTISGYLNMAEFIGQVELEKLDLSLDAHYA